MEACKINWIIDEKHSGLRLRRYLRRNLSFSNSVLRAVQYDGGQILINNRKVDVRYEIKTGDILTVVFPREERGFYMKPENIPLSIVYEDDHLLVIDKQAGIVTAPNPHTPEGTIANGILAYYDKLNLPFTAHIVTRLDRNTSGLMLVAKHRYIHSLLTKVQQEDLIYREYRVIIEGHLKNRNGTIDLPIGRKPGSIIERTVTDAGRHALTHYEMIKKADHTSFVKVNLETGRTHQIRVHFAALGHPVVGDDLYGGCTQKIDRQALHCYKLKFPHPITNQMLSFTSHIPNDMESLI